MYDVKVCRLWLARGYEAPAAQSFSFRRLSNTTAHFQTKTLSFFVSCFVSVIRRKLPIVSLTYLKPQIARTKMAPPPRDENENFRPMEMEVLNTPMQVGSSTARRSRSDPLDQLWMLIRLYIEYYPKISIVLGLAMLGGVLFVMGSSMRAPVTRNRLEHDYTAIGLNYNFKASQIDHWCLFVSLQNF